MVNVTFNETTERAASIETPSGSSEYEEGADMFLAVFSKLGSPRHLQQQKTFWDERSSVIRVNDHQVAYEHDDAGIPIQVGDLSIEHPDPLTHVRTLGDLVETSERNEFVEVDHVEVRHGDELVFERTVTSRSPLGCAEEVEETLEGVTTQYRYEYAAGGCSAITKVWINDTLETECEYSRDGLPTRCTTEGETQIFTANEAGFITDTGDCLRTMNANGYLATTTCSDETTSYNYEGERLSSITLPNGTEIKLVYGAVHPEAVLLDDELVGQFLWSGDQLLADTNQDGEENHNVFASADDLIPMYVHREEQNYLGIYNENGSVSLVAGAGDGKIHDRSDLRNAWLTMQDTPPDSPLYTIAGLVEMPFARLLYHPPSKTWLDSETCQSLIRSPATLTTPVLKPYDSNSALGQVRAALFRGNSHLPPHLRPKSHFYRNFIDAHAIEFELLELREENLSLRAQVARMRANVDDRLAPNSRVNYSGGEYDGAVRATEESYAFVRAFSRAKIRSALYKIFGGLDVPVTIFEDDYLACPEPDAAEDESNTDSSTTDTGEDETPSQGVMTEVSKYPLVN